MKPTPANKWHAFRLATTSTSCRMLRSACFSSARYELSVSVNFFAYIPWRTFSMLEAEYTLTTRIGNLTDDHSRLIVEEMSVILSTESCMRRLDASACSTNLFTGQCNAIADVHCQSHRLFESASRTLSLPSLSLFIRCTASANRFSSSAGPRIIRI